MMERLCCYDSSVLSRVEQSLECDEVSWFLFIIFSLLVMIGMFGLEESGDLLDEA